MRPSSTGWGSNARRAELEHGLSCSRMPPLAVEHVARAVDHTLLDPGAGDAPLIALCREADEHGFAAVCVYPWWVARARALLHRGAAVCTVVSFPHGLDATAAKCEAARVAIAAGADEIDVVIAHADRKSTRLN